MTCKFFDHGWNLRKLVWAFEFWNEMLVSNIRCKKSVEESSSFRVSVLEFWEERGEKLMTCHLFLDNFSWNFMTFGLFFKGLEFWNKVFVSKNLNISILKSWNVRLFWIIVFRKRHIIAEIWLCFRACNSRIVTYDQEFYLVVWFLCFNHCYGIFWKVSLKKLWCCRKHVFVFEIVSLKAFE